MRLALDAMGGDHAPRAMVDGALRYAREFRMHEVVLVGRKPDLEPLLTGAPANIAVEHAPDVIGMAEKMAALKERPNNSINVCTRLLKQGKVDGIVLCGNTGCSVSAAQLNLRRIRGVRRAGLLAALPKPSGHTWVCDVGANNVNKGDHLVQFAEMTVAYVERALGRQRPKVGVLANGSEDEKGNDLTHEALALLRKTDLNVVGKVEGHHIYSDEVDVVVCDGFVGNIVLKTSEGVEKALSSMIREEISRGLLTSIGGGLAKPAFGRVRRRADWRFTGGSPLLGVDGVTIKGHGRSDDIAVFHALKQAATAVDAKLIETLRARFANVGPDEAVA